MPTHLAAWVLLAFLAFFAFSAMWANNRPRPGLAVRLRLAVGIDGFTCYGVSAMDMPLDRKVTLTIVALDDKDRAADPATVTGLSWQATGDGLVVADDKLSAVYTSTLGGEVTITVTATNSDNAVLEDSVTITVKAGVAVKLQLTVSEPAPL